jgi:hypothetical protein
MVTLLRFIKNRLVDPTELNESNLPGCRGWNRRTKARVGDCLENNHESYMSIWSWMVYEDRDFKGDKAFCTVAVTV